MHWTSGAHYHTAVPIKYNYRYIWYYIIICSLKNSKTWLKREGYWRYLTAVWTQKLWMFESRLFGQLRYAFHKVGIRIMAYLSVKWIRTPKPIQDKHCPDAYGWFNELNRPYPWSTLTAIGQNMKSTGVRSLISMQFICRRPKWKIANGAQCWLRTWCVELIKPTVCVQTVFVLTEFWYFQSLDWQDVWHTCCKWPNDLLSNPDCCVYMAEWTHTH